MLQKNYYKKFNSNIIPIFIPHMGCPNDCVFCNQRKITGCSTDITTSDIENIINQALKYNLKTPIVAFYGGSFTALPIELQAEFYNVINSYIKAGKIHGVKLSTRPDAINSDVIFLLKKYNVSMVELGVQSMNDDVLVESKRNHTVEDIYKACDMLYKNGINFGIQQMVGLPGDNFENILESTKKIISLKPDCVRIYPTLVLKDTQLQKMYESGKYKPLDIATAVEYCARIYIEYLMANVNVIRVGLQASEDLDSGDSIVVGPYHPSFGQLVNDYLYKFVIDRVIKSSPDLINSDKLCIYAAPCRISEIAGINGDTKQYIVKKYGYKKLSLYKNDTIDLSHIRLCNNIGVEIEVDLEREIGRIWGE